MRIWHQTSLHFSWYTILPCKITHVHTEAMMWFTLWCWCCFFLIVSGFLFSVTSMKDLLLYQCSCSWIVSCFKMSFKHCAEVRLKGNYKCVHDVEDRARPGVTKTSWTGGVSSVVALVVVPRSHHWWLIKSLFLFLSCQVLSAWTQNALILFHSYKAQKIVVVAKTDCESEMLPSAGPFL